MANNFNLGQIFKKSMGVCVLTVLSSSVNAETAPKVISSSKATAQKPSSTMNSFQNQQGQKMKKQKYSADTCSFPKDDESLKKLLSPEQYAITKKNGTERPFDNSYWNNHHLGIYVDVISQEPLFSSKDKFDSGTGWPSFTKPLKKEVVVEKKDTAHGMSRVEIRSKRSDSHLGHVFDDGPSDQGGLRYCMNSASLKFIPLEKMDEEGYSDYLNLFTAEELKQAKKNPYAK